MILVFPPYHLPSLSSDCHARRQDIQRLQGLNASDRDFRLMQEYISGKCNLICCC